MAMTDLTAGFLTIFSGLVKWGEVVEVEHRVCLMMNMIDVSIAIASLQHVLAVNLERYIAIIMPLKYKVYMTRRKLAFGLASLWIYSALLGVGYINSIEMNKNCTFGVPYRPVMTFLIHVLMYPIPLVILIWIYFHIVIIIKRQIRFLEQNSSMAIALTANRRMMKSISAIFAAYIFCWTPAFVGLLTISATELFQIDLQLNRYQALFDFTEILTYSNSLINPIIYFVLRRDFMVVCKTCLHCKHQNNNGSGSSSARNAFVLGAIPRP